MRFIWILDLEIFIVLFELANSTNQSKIKIPYMKMIYSIKCLVII